MHIAGDIIYADTNIIIILERIKNMTFDGHKIYCYDPRTNVVRL